MVCFFSKKPYCCQPSFQNICKLLQTKQNKSWTCLQKFKCVYNCVIKNHRTKIGHFVFHSPWLNNGSNKLTPLTVLPPGTTPITPRFITTFEAVWRQNGVLGSCRFDLIYQCSFNSFRQRVLDTKEASILVRPSSHSLNKQTSSEYCFLMRCLVSAQAATESLRASLAG